MSEAEKFLTTILLVKAEKRSRSITVDQKIEDSEGLKSNEELKHSRALKVRDEENTEKENVTTTVPYAQRVAGWFKINHLLSFQFFHGTPAPT